LTEPAAPRHRGLPRRLDAAAQPAELSTEDNFKRVFYEFMATLTERMDQNGVRLYTTIENSLIAAANGQLYADEII
jgi:hypothetical protein